MSKIIRLEVSNLLRIRAAEISPDGALVIVAGNNNAGKSSLLNSIAIALSGKDLPAQPIREGAASGHVILTLDDLVVTRKFSQTGGMSLEVRDKDGAKISSPQKKLDLLMSKTTFDPLTFTMQKPDEQLATLKRIVGLDFTDLDKARAEKYAARTEVGRRKKEAEGLLTSLNRHEDAPNNEVTVSSLAEELNAANEKNKANDESRTALGNLNDAVDEAAAAVQAAEAALKRAQEHHAALIVSRDKQKELVAKLEDVNTEALVDKMKNAEAINAKVREKKQWMEAHRKTITIETEYSALTKEIEAIDEHKSEAMQKATFPVEGLGFNELGVTFNDLPFEQASSSVKIRTSLAIACALNPNLRVMLIRDGSLLDSNSMQMVREYAEKHDAVVFCECVGERDDAAVIIEDGMVKEAK